MPRIKTESLQEGNVVGSDVKNIDGMLLIPAGAVLTARQIGILQAWGVAEVEVEAAAETAEDDPLAMLPPEVVTKLTAEIKSLFWQPDESSPVFQEIFRLVLRRRAITKPMR
jgi:hypothetical protein